MPVKKLTVAAVVMIILGLGFSLAALNRQLQWGIQWGPAGTWASAMLSTIAVSIAAWVAVDNVKQRTREELEESRKAEARALRRAKRVRVRVTWDASLPGGGGGWMVNVDNGDDRAVYDLQWLGGLAVAHDLESYRSEFAVTFPHPTGLLQPGESYATMIRASRMGSTDAVDIREGAFALLPAVTFEDDDGYVFCWVNDPPAQIVRIGGRATGKWQLMDDSRKNYPVDDSEMAGLYEFSKLPAIEQAAIAKKARERQLVEAGERETTAE
ncbi:hypothetical protein ACW2Q0_05990 [Nocardia sp. R16R-3T]